MLPGSIYPICRPSSRPSLLACSLPTLHFFRQLGLRQRLCVLFLLISFLSFVYIFLPKYFTGPGSQIFFSGTSANIRFTSACKQHVVPAFHPCRQHCQACVIPALHDGPACPRLLGFALTTTWRLSFRIRFSTLCLYFPCVKITTT